jgi:hypothetical protein
MNPITGYITTILIVCAILTIMILAGIHYIIKKYGMRMVDWYIDALENIPFVYYLTGFVMLGLFLTFWYCIYHIFF